MIIKLPRLRIYRNCVQLEKEWACETVNRFLKYRYLGDTKGEAMRLCLRALEEKLLQQQGERERKEWEKEEALKAAGVGVTP